MVCKAGRPDMTFAVDWALKTNDLFIYIPTPILLLYNITSYSVALRTHTLRTPQVGALGYQRLILSKREVGI